jgi:hypothetical protein
LLDKRLFDLTEFHPTQALFTQHLAQYVIGNLVDRRQTLCPQKNRNTSSTRNITGLLGPFCNSESG